MQFLKEIKRAIKNKYWIRVVHTNVKFNIPAKLFGEKYAIWKSKRNFRKTFGRELNLEDPQTLNEKILWLKLNVKEDFHTTCADKYAVREYWKQFGEEGLIPLLYKTDDWRDITLDIIPDEPCIIKCNTGSGTYQIIRDKKAVNIEELRQKCRIWLYENYYYRSQEWQYKNIKPCIIIEKLLRDKNGHIPNDYKLNFINGKLVFVYCSVDREGENYRAIYDPEWNRMNVEWVKPKDHKGFAGTGIPKPETFERMVEIGEKVAANFAYVRVDFYDVDGKLYYGEITLHHGGGTDTFEPEEYDMIFGQMLKLPQ